jgi:hypothetical protein
MHFVPGGDSAFDGCIAHVALQVQLANFMLLVVLLKRGA